MIPLSAVRLVSPAPREVWQRLAARPEAFVTQSPAWAAAAHAARGWTDASRLYLLPDGRELLLPLAGRVVGGVRVSEESWPYGWGYGGLLTTDGTISEVEAALVLGDLARRPVLRAAVVPVPSRGGTWSRSAPPGTRRVRYVTQVVDLQGGFGAVWSSRYKKSTRNYVRAAQRRPLEVRREHGGDIVTTFAALYAQSLARFARLRGQPRLLARWWARHQDRAGQVAAVASALGNRCVFWSAWRAGEPVAVLVVLQSGDSALSWLTAIDRGAADETLATYLLQSHAIEDACRRGAREFHLGETDPGSGVERYKAKWGARLLTYDALRLERLPLTGAEHYARHAARAVAASRVRRRAAAPPPP